MSDRTDLFKAAALGLTLVSAPVLAKQPQPERLPTVTFNSTFNTQGSKACPEGMTCEGGSYILQPIVAPKDVMMGIGYFKGSKGNASPNESFRLQQPRQDRSVVGVGVRIAF